MSVPQFESGAELVEELNTFLKRELQILSSDLKDVKQDLRTFNFKFSRIERKLEGLEKVSQ